MSGHLPWYQVNIYPSTKQEKMLVVVVENKGYNLPCDHMKDHKCKKSHLFKKSKFVAGMFDVPLRHPHSVHEAVVHALDVWVHGNELEKGGYRD